MKYLWRKLINWIKNQSPIGYQDSRGFHYGELNSRKYILTRDNTKLYY